MDSGARSWGCCAKAAIVRGALPIEDDIPVIRDRRRTAAISEFLRFGEPVFTKRGAVFRAQCGLPKNAAGPVAAPSHAACKVSMLEA
jgi:hypothetical protein